MNNIIIGNLNINSLSSKFDDLKVLIAGMFYILLITEIKRFKEDISGLFVEINFKLLSEIYHPPSQPDQYFFDSLDKALDVYCNYEKAVLVGAYGWRF